MKNQAIKERDVIALTVNGEQQSVRAATLRELLTELELEGEFFAIAVNRRVVVRQRWDEAILKNGDTIEIVTPRQGG